MFKFTLNEATANRRRIFFYAVSATDGYTAVTTGLSTSTSVYIVKNGVTPGTTPVSPTFTHIDSGLWYYEMTTANVDTVGVLSVRISDALIRTVHLVGYVYNGDPMAAIPSFPTNFASLAITVGGAVTAGTVSDKTGYALSGTQTFNVTGNITGNLSGSVGSVTGAVGSVTGAVGSVTGAVGSVTGAVGSVTGAVGSVTGNVGGNVVGSVGSLTATAVQNVWDDLTVNNTVTGSVGKLVVDNLNATVSSRSTLTAADVWNSLTSGFVTVGSVGKLILDNLNATVSSRSTLTAANVWDALESSITTVNSIGLKLKTNLDAAITTRMASFTYTAPLDTTGTASAVWNALVATYTTSTTFGGRLVRTRSTSPSNETFITSANHIASDVHEMQPDVFTATVLATSAVTEITQGIWNQSRATASPTNTVPASGTFGFYLDQQVSTVSGGGGITAADVWAYSPRALTDKAGFSLATSQTFNTTGSVGSVTGSVGSVSGAVTVGTVNADVINATALSADACAEIADAILNRNIATGSSTGRTVKDVMKLLRNKVTVSATTLTVYEADGTTIAWTAAVTSDAAATPITGVTP